MPAGRARDCTGLHCDVGLVLATQWHEVGGEDEDEDEEGDETVSPAGTLQGASSWQLVGVVKGTRDERLASLVHDGGGEEDGTPGRVGGRE